MKWEKNMFIGQSIQALDSKGRLNILPTIQKDIRDFLRIIYSNASECSLDNQGRILIPPTLRDFAGLQKDIAMLGIMNKIEIWSKDKWNEFKDNVKDKAK